MLFFLLQPPLSLEHLLPEHPRKTTYIFYIHRYLPINIYNILQGGSRDCPALLLRGLPGHLVGNMHCPAFVLLRLPGVQLGCAAGKVRCCGHWWCGAGACVAACLLALPCFSVAVLHALAPCLIAVHTDGWYCAGLARTPHAKLSAQIYCSICKILYCARPVIPFLPTGFLMVIQCVFPFVYPYFT